jgi:hypothetical protein
VKAPLLLEMDDKGGLRKMMSNDVRQMLDPRISALIGTQIRFVMRIVLIKIYHRTNKGWYLSSDHLGQLDIAGATSASSIQG